MNQISTRLTTFINRFTRTELIAAGILGASSILALSFGKRYFNGGVCNISKDLSGQIVVITGANTGIGKETARILASMGATVILACRDPLKADAAVEELRRVTNNPRIEFMHLDLGDLESIKAFAEEFRSKYQKLNILINNAGVMAPNTRTLTKDGFELQFQVNYLGHFYLTKSLLDIIKASGPSRIINLSSVRHEKGRMHWDDLMFEHKYSPFVAYDQSKLAVVMFTKELQKRLDQEGADVKVVALHPGLVRTELGRHVKQNFTTKLALILATPLYIYVTKDIHQGAQTTLYCALTDHHNLKGGYYYSDCKVTGANPEAVIGENGERLWEYSEKVISQKLKEPIWL